MKRDGSIRLIAPVSIGSAMIGLTLYDKFDDNSGGVGLDPKNYINTRILPSANEVPPKGNLKNLDWLDLPIATGRKDAPSWRPEDLPRAQYEPEMPAARIGDSAFAEVTSGEILVRSEIAPLSLPVPTFGRVSDHLVDLSDLVGIYPIEVEAAERSIVEIAPTPIVNDIDLAVPIIFPEVEFGSVQTIPLEEKKLEYWQWTSVDAGLESVAESHEVSPFSDQIVGRGDKPKGTLKFGEVAPELGEPDQSIGIEAVKENPANTFSPSDNSIEHLGLGYSVPDVSSAGHSDLSEEAGIGQIETVDVAADLQPLELLPALEVEANARPVEQNLAEPATKTISLISATEDERLETANQKQAQAQTGDQLHSPVPAVAVQSASQIGPDSSPGQQTFPVEETTPLFSYDDELILQLRVKGTSATETIIAYGNLGGVYLPLGEMSRMLDLPIRISDDGHYANGWFLSEDRTITVSLKEEQIQAAGKQIEYDRMTVQAFDGELFLRTDVFAKLFPLEVETDLRSQAVILNTLEPFPFEERMRREAERKRLNSRNNKPEPDRWPREETPWAALSVPIVDVEMRAVSDATRGERGEADFRLAGDLAFLTAQAFVSTSTQDGLNAAIVELGRRDADADLLGPLKATQVLLGDVATNAMPLGLRGASGRGAFISNQEIDGASLFDEIDFRGVLPSGYEVELYRNEVLLGSTRERVNGQYEFLQTPVDYGLNVFRLVFYGPQGQRREEVRRISVGDGRLKPGEFIYSAGVVEQGQNLLGVRGPDFRPDARFGDLQASGELSYGFSRMFTGTIGGAFFEEFGQKRWLATAGIRTGIGGYAVRGDVGLSDGGGKAFGLGLGGRVLDGGLRLTHFEYSGPFVDELRGIGNQPLTRATEVDFNTTIGFLGDSQLPLNLRGQRIAYQDGRVQTNATLRASARLPGLLGSNTLSYTDTSSPDGLGFSQVLGSFDLATFNRSSTQVRGSVGYRVHPNPTITQVAAEVSHAFDDRTVVRGSAGYAFETKDAVVGLSAIREFDKFTLALDGQYDFGRKEHTAALRLSFSLGRDPVRKRFFAAKPGLASSGAIAVRAFHDLDGDKQFGPGDRPLPEVTFSSSHTTAQTDEDGLARLGELGNGNRAVVQVDPSSLPDIFMAPVNRGIEIVPRAGRFHTSEFPIIELSEVEGTVTFKQDGGSRGVSGLKLQMLDETGELVEYIRTERGGYFFFERVQPGTYQLILDPEQAKRLGLCLSGTKNLEVGSASDILTHDLVVSECSIGLDAAGA